MEAIAKRMYPIPVRIVDAVTRTFAETVRTRKPVTTAVLKLVLFICFNCN